MIEPNPNCKCVITPSGAYWVQLPGRLQRDQKVVRKWIYAYKHGGIVQWRSREYTVEEYRFAQSKAGQRWRDYEFCLVRYAAPDDPWKSLEETRKLYDRDLRGRL